jgi:hypothetical protein
MAGKFLSSIKVIWSNQLLTLTIQNMKNFKQILVTILVLTSIISCKKDDK